MNLPLQPYDLWSYLCITHQLQPFLALFPIPPSSIHHPIVVTVHRHHPHHAITHTTLHPSHTAKHNDSKHCVLCNYLPGLLSVAAVDGGLDHSHGVHVACENERKQFSRIDTALKWHVVHSLEHCTTAWSKHKINTQPTSTHTYSKTT